MGRSSRALSLAVFFCAGLGCGARATLPIEASTGGGASSAAVTGSTSSTISTSSTGGAPATGPWVVTIGDGEGDQGYVVALELAPDGDLVAAGTFAGSTTVGGETHTSPGEEGDAFVIKLSTDGEVRWFAQLSAQAAVLYGLGVGADGSIVVGGAASGELWGDPPVPGSLEPDAYLWKLNKDGQTEWTKSIASPADRVVSVSTVVVGASGTIFATGAYHDNASIEGIQLPSAPGATQSSFEAAFSPDGEVIWAKGYNHQFFDDARSAGGDKRVLGGLVENANGSGSQYVIAMHDAAGDVQGEALFDVGVPALPYSSRIAVDSGGVINAVLDTGQFPPETDFGFGPKGDAGYVLMEIGPDFTVQLATALVNGQSAHNAIADVGVRPAGGFALAGRFDAGLQVYVAEQTLTAQSSVNDTFFARLESLGSDEEATSYPGGDIARIRADAQDRMYLAGWYSGSDTNLSVPLPAIGGVHGLIMRMSW